MLSLYTAYDLQMELKEFIKSARKKDKLSVQKMADLSGVPYATIRKFESSGNISLRQFLMLYETVGDLKKVKELTKSSEPEFKSIEDVLRHA
ncbi:helix-turn-helix domain-containing protein [Vibrio lentus]|jgi:transcriptional regulator with XRE-family HTH domain|uniref:Transcriptional regulator n=2 Tax=Gammaproteobacteria TaxID=1236 RepID=A0AB36XRR2_9VIBR|nr:MULTISPECIES: helix-turn-helix transcriptional regulator [Gammaproteobacteria]CAH6785113.1 Helix-turn-helix protein [Vibrio chagasii]MCC4839687.1 helix-turn-helix domain-containing protein [Vibrio lentus]MCF7498197.1 helix-turn-helix domain-containing protein [Vibrio sp. L5-1]MCG9641329.1 helix-turn-helix domain-containing protein [Vibrio sp. Isolate34]MCG9753445.1 helix-turn-helix domain-containing protein [Vibrio brasiliensis]